MADIKQAAKWLKAERDAIRHDRDWWLTPYFPRLVTFEVAGAEHELNCDDLAADDWELVP